MKGSQSYYVRSYHLATHAGLWYDLPKWKLIGPNALIASGFTVPHLQRTLSNLHLALLTRHLAWNTAHGIMCLLILCRISKKLRQPQTRNSKFKEFPSFEQPCSKHRHHTHDANTSSPKFPSVLPRPPHTSPHVDSQVARA